MMSPQFTSCEASSRESSAGEFRRAGLALRKPGPAPRRSSPRRGQGSFPRRSGSTAGPRFARVITTRARVDPLRTRGRPGSHRPRSDQSARRHGPVRARQPSPVDGWRGTLLVEPGSSHQSGDRAARTRFSGRRPRLRALPASRHRIRIGKLIHHPLNNLHTTDFSGSMASSVSPMESSRTSRSYAS